MTLAFRVRLILYFLSFSWECGSVFTDKVNWMWNSSAYILNYSNGSFPTWLFLKGKEKVLLSVCPPCKHILNFDSHYQCEARSDELFLTLSFLYILWHVGKKNHSLFHFIFMLASSSIFACFPQKIRNLCK